MTDTNPDTFGAVFRARMNELRMPLGELARRLGVTTTRTRQLLAARNLREDTVRRLCAALYLRPVWTPVAICDRIAVPPEMVVAPWYAAPSAPADPLPTE